MNKVAIAIEKSIKYWRRFKKKYYNLDNLNYNFNMNYSVCTLAANVNAKAIIAYTNTINTDINLLVALSGNTNDIKNNIPIIIPVNIKDLNPDLYDSPKFNLYFLLIK